MKRSAILAALLLVSGPARAGWYFSDCGVNVTNRGEADTLLPGGVAASTLSACNHYATGLGSCKFIATGGTSEGNPLCLDPGNTGTVNSFEQELLPSGGITAGSTVYLCAGRCDGYGTAIWHLSSHPTNVSADSCGTNNGRSVFEYQVNGPITFQPYCEAGHCETVILDGDANGDNVYQAGEADHIINTGSCVGGVFSGKGDYTWEGDPLGEGIAHIVLQKAVVFPVYDQGLPAGKTNIYHGLEIRYQSSEFWKCPGDANTSTFGTHCPGYPDDGVGGVSINCAPNDSGAFGLTRARGTFSATFNKMHHLCFAALRSNNNCQDSNGNATQAAGCTSGVTAIQFSDNDIWNAGSGYNSHQDRNLTYARNRLRDVTYAIGIEEQNTDILVEDNSIGCTGTYDTNIGASNTYGKCVYGIAVSDGDAPPSDGCADSGGHEGVCTAHNIRIRRNSVYSSGRENEAGKGFFVTGISWTAHNSSGDLGTSIIENNIISYPSQTASTWTVQKEDFNASSVEAGLAVLSENQLTIQGNTIYRAGYPVVLGGANHIFRDNAIYKTYSDGAGSDRPEICVVSGSPSITYNSISPGASSQDAPICYWDGGCRDVANGIFDRCSNTQDAGTSCAGDVSPSAASSCATARSCTDVNTGVAGAGNKCSTSLACTFGDIANADKAQWNLHLDGTDATCVDAGTAGETDDFDRDARTGTIDIGADEIVPGANGRRRVL